MPDAPTLENSEIRTGRIINPNKIVILLEFPGIAERDIPHTGVGIWRPDQVWVKGRLDYNGISVAAMSDKVSSDAPFVIIGNSGKYTVVEGDTSTSGVIVKEDALASGRLVKNSVIAVGILGGVYRMKDANNWDVLTSKAIEENLSAACAHPSGGFLVCGWQGLVAHYNDDVVERIETGTNVILTDIICDSDGEIFACGQRGIVIRGTRDSLRPIELDGITDDFWSIVKFQGQVYLSTAVALYKLIDDETLELVKFDVEVVATSFYHLHSYEDSLLLSVGKKDAVLFDGNEWIRIL